MSWQFPGTADQWTEYVRPGLAKVYMIGRADGAAAREDWWPHGCLLHGWPAYACGGCAYERGVRDGQRETTSTEKEG